MKKYRFDEHGVGYKIGQTLQPFRPQFSIILDWVKEGSSVLDIGCGDGVLGERLIKEKNCQVFGFDLDAIGVKESKRRKIQAKIHDMDEPFPYKNKQFDIVICSDVLQCSLKPDVLLSEALRVGKKVIIYFPNFGFWFYRLQTLFGHFPTLALFGHTWWNTRQTRFFSLSDFMSMTAMNRVSINKLVCIDWKNREVSWLAKIWPNLFGRGCVLMIEKTNR